MQNQTADDVLASYSNAELGITVTLSKVAKGWAIVQHDDDAGELIERTTGANQMVIRARYRKIVKGLQA